MATRAVVPASTAMATGAQTATTAMATRAKKNGKHGDGDVGGGAIKHGGGDDGKAPKRMTLPVEGESVRAIAASANARRMQTVAAAKAAVTATAKWSRQEKKTRPAKRRTLPVEGEWVRAIAVCTNARRKQTVAAAKAAEGEGISFAS